MKTIGIPRALLYYDYAPFFITFFKEAGITPVVSKKTDQDIINRGKTLTISEFCLPIKAFIGHVDYLSDKCDAVFVPSLMTAGKVNYLCPKIIASPDIARVSKKTKYLELNFDDAKNYESTTDVMLKLGISLKKNPLKIYSAAKKAQEALRKYRNRMKTGMYVDGDHFIRINRKRKLIGLIGHPYMLYDSFMNQNIVSKILKSGYSIIGQDSVPVKQDTSLKFHWNYANRMENGFEAFSKDSQVRGIIYLTPFSCSSDALVRQHMIIKAKTIGKPFMILSYDEHTAEAGQDTRIEAFMDMLK